MSRVIGAAVICCSIVAAGWGMKPQTWRFDSEAVPAGWALSGQGAASRGALMVTGVGTTSTARWSHPLGDARAGDTVRISFRARATTNTAGAVTGGLNVCSRDYPPSLEWQEHTQFCTVPTVKAQPAVVLGQFHLPGSAEFTSASVTPVTPVYRRCQGQSLGDGEMLDNLTYRFVAPYGAVGNPARVASAIGAEFNTNRWVMTEGQRIVYAHTLDTARQTSAVVTLQLGRHLGGCFVVSASADGTSWTEAGRANKEGFHKFTLPESLFRRRDVLVRIGVERETTGPVGMTLMQYHYEAGLDSPFKPAQGQTVFAEALESRPGFLCQPTDVVSSGVQVSLLSLSRATRCVVSVGLEQPGRPVQREVVPVALVRATTTTIVLPIRATAAGPASMRIELSDASSGVVLGGSRIDLRVSHYELTNYGARLRGIDNVWTCGSTYKVHPDRPLPQQATDAVQFRGAGRERVHAQLIVAPTADSQATFRVSGLAGPHGARITSDSIRVRRVGNVPVRTPTDSMGSMGEWPDLLLPIDGPVRLDGGRNNALWITVTIPANTPAGDYRGELSLTYGKRLTRVPLIVHVYDFSLPEKTELRSGFGVSSRRIAQYHNLDRDDTTTTGPMAAVWDGYMRNFAEKRLCPYDPMAQAPIQVRREGEGSSETVAVDFAGYDAQARRYLEGLGFNSFVLHVQGLGTGRYPKFNTGEFLGARAGTDRYERLMCDYGAKVKAHLDKLGWTRKAYVYCYDEPTPKDYDFVSSSMATLRRCFPGVTRMLTEEMQPALIGNVDLWCPILDAYHHDQAAARQKAGEEVWWYICCGPRTPYVGEFIDHPAIDLRMWLWQTWKYQVQGILIWETCWWAGGPDPSGLQNPYTDPMSYNDRGDPTWGNGDGRFFYPPTGTPRSDGRAYVSEPVDSLRWELLAIGVQDWEYFNLLNKYCNAAEKAGHSPRDVAAARSLLNIPPEICRTLTDYTHDPAALEIHRDRIAQAIERMKAE